MRVFSMSLRALMRSSCRACDSSAWAAASSLAASLPTRTRSWASESCLRARSTESWNIWMARTARA